MSFEHVGVADAKRRFSELTERVGRGESFVIVSRGRPVVALVPPQRLGADDDVTPIGLAAFAGTLAGDWDSVDEDMAEVIAARQRVVDRPPPRTPITVGEPFYGARRVGRAELNGAGARGAELGRRTDVDHPKG